MRVEPIESFCSGDSKNLTLKRHVLSDEVKNILAIYEREIIFLITKMFKVKNVKFMQEKMNLFRSTMPLKIINKNFLEFESSFRKNFSSEGVKNSNVTLRNGYVYYHSENFNDDLHKSTIMSNDEADEFVIMTNHVIKTRLSYKKYFHKIAEFLDKQIPYGGISYDDNVLEPKNIYEVFLNSIKMYGFNTNERKILLDLVEFTVLRNLSGILKKIEKTCLDYNKQSAEKTFSKTGGIKNLNNQKIQNHEYYHCFEVQKPEIPSLNNFLNKNPKLVLTESLKQSHRSSFLDKNRKNLTFYDIRINNFHMPLSELVSKELPRLNSSGNSRSISGKEKVVVDFVEKIFFNMMSVSDVPHKIRNLIERLKVIALCIALQDEGFLKNKKHPLRVLINNIANIGFDWVGPKQTDKRCLSLLEGIVMHVEKNFTGDIAMLKDLNQELTKIIDNDKKSRLVGIRLQKAEDAKNATLHAHFVINKTLKVMFRNRYIPVSIYPFVDLVWRKNMLLTYFREGIMSDVWKFHTKKLAQIIWVLQPSLRRFQKNRLMKTTSTLKLYIKESMQAVPLPTQKRIAIESAFKKHFQNSLANLGDSDFNEPNVKLSHYESNENTKNTFSPTIETKLFLEKLRMDTWIEYETKKFEKVRGKFVCAINNGEKYIFVNRFGHKLIDLTFEELEMALKSHKIRILDFTDVFDKALAKAIENLRKSSQAKEVVMLEA